MMPITVISEIPRLLLAFVVEQAGLSLNWSHNGKGIFSNNVAQILWDVRVFQNYWNKYNYK